MIKAGIIGGAGYTGGEMLRILLNHPQVEISFVHSKSNAGNYLYDVHYDLLGDTEMKFASEIRTDIDILFLCVGHGDARKFLEQNPISDNVKIIDLSQDFRLTDKASIGNKVFVYGLPEMQKENIQKAQNIANPGCFATCIQLGVLPLAQAGLLKNEVHISATTGSTGAGQSLSATSHFTWRANNLSTYKEFEHQHLKEIKQSIKQMQGEVADLLFLPYRGAFTRGILASIYTETDLEEEAVKELYKVHYQNHPFTWVSDRAIDLKEVVNTNKCFVHIAKHGKQVLITSIIDNLLKGASGQAVQNMNLMFGLEETLGLKLKPIAF